MRSDVVVVGLHPRYEFLGAHRAVKAPHYLCPLAECPVQPFKDVVVRLRLEILKTDVRILDGFRNIIKFGLDCLLICL